MRAELRTFELLAALMLIGTAVGCTEEEEAEIGTQAEGESCAQISDCQAGLDCADGTCVPLESFYDGPAVGTECETEADCQEAHFCGRGGFCRDTPELDLGEACWLTIDCRDPLICSGIDGVCVSPGSLGTADLGEACEEISDCRRPYVCGLDDTCTTLPFFAGADCTLTQAELGVYRVHHELPTDPLSDPHEFYRLPFPNDIRVTDGRIDLEGHASPGEVLGLNVSKLYFDAVQEDVEGFATNGPLFFRFSDEVDTTTLCLDPGGIYPEFPEGDPGYCTGDGDPAATVFLVNVDPASPEYNVRLPVKLETGLEAGSFICNNWLGIAPIAGQPLRRNTTYAAVVTTGARAARDGAVPVQDLDFAAVLADEGLTDHVSAATEPLRDWINDTGVDASTLAAATVFTTGEPEVVAQKLRQAVHEQPLPGFDNNAVVCGAAVVSPCEDGLTGIDHQRGCFGEQVGFFEIQGTFDGLVFQQGTRPYLEPEAGGAFVLDANGKPIVQDSEDMCYALAVPDAAMPPGGWPIIIVGHGTGGSFRGFVSGDGALLTGLGYAVLSFDNVSHGNRQGVPPPLWQDPGELFFNILNPRAARDNILQGAADLFQMVRLVSQASVTPTDPGATGFSGTVSFDADEIYYYGHSQGTVIAPPFLVAETDIQATVMSGAGAELALSILNKKKPTDVSAVASVFFGDQNMTRIHPMMGLLALFFGASDAVNYVEHIVIDPLPGLTPLPIMQTYGIGDSFTPEVTQQAWVRGMGAPIVGTVEVPIAGVPSTASPAQNNAGPAGSQVTAGVVQLVPDGAYDGHFVIFDHPLGRAALSSFFSTAAAGTPSIQK